VRRRSPAWHLAFHALVALALVVSLGPALGGCGAPEPRIVVWHAYRGDEERALAEVSRAWEAEGGTKVTLLSIPFDAFVAKVEAAVPRGNGPDLFIDGHQRLGSYARNALVADPGDAFPPGDEARYDATSVAAVSPEGRARAVPLSAKCLALFVNERLATEPVAALADLERLPLPAGAFPLAYESEIAFFHAPFLHAYGGRMLDAEGGFGMVGERAEASLAYVKGLKDRGAIPDEPGGALVKQLFLGGNAAALISGPWFLAEIHGEVPYRVTPLPRTVPDGPQLAPFVTIEAAMLTPQGARRPEARRFARYLGDEGSARTRAIVGRQVVSTVSAWRLPELANDRVLSAFHEAARLGIPTPSSTRMQAAWVPADQAVKKVLRGAASPHDALVEAKARFDDVLRPPPPPPAPTALVLVAGAALLLLAWRAVVRARQPGFGAELARSMPAYRYVIHSSVTIAVLVVFPLLAGAATSFFAGPRGETRYVGFANYVGILTARGGALLGHGSFWSTLLVTILWTLGNVVFHLAIGVGLGLLLSRPWLRLRAAYRVLLILPWAVPSYVTALAWKGMFHRQYGAMNAILSLVGAEPVSWFSRFSTAFTANVLTNVWLGFPFMMVVTMGALTAIPKDVLEAAEVDGATRWQRFRRVTWPLLLPSLLPSVVLGSVWTFNMFNVVFLVSGGEPDGTTDILVSEAYRWAFTRDAQYGYAAAYAVLIFLLLLGGTRLLDRLVPRERRAA
jgi:arabinogalactan oligomer/maltooligosaccharide transport system permease protein